LVWLYWNTLAELAGIWAVDPQYSHGYLVPVFAVALLFFRRHQIGSGISQPSWWAVPLVLIGIAMRLLDAYFYLRWLGQASLLPLLAGICLAVGGRAALRWAWPAIAYLLFMIPLPGRLEGFLAYPLQRIATIGSTNILQTLGFFAQSEGNVILLNEAELGVVDACKGLHMLMVFFALSTGVAILSQRPWYHRLLIVLGAVPIALLCNIIRIALVGAVTELASAELGQKIFHHPLTGFAMIALALAFLSLECWILARLFVPNPNAAAALSGPENLAPAGVAPAKKSPPSNGSARKSAGAVSTES
jgi:exosortase